MNANHLTEVLLEDLISNPLSSMSDMDPVSLKCRITTEY